MVLCNDSDSFLLLLFDIVSSEQMHSKKRSSKSLILLQIIPF